ncbi:Rab-GAP TBC domain-containing protein [Aphelenchoides fujianensis]|nr:Rab-GAP TBC domain-containing protein [Aphelenchoides fujianensis]
MPSYNDEEIRMINSVDWSTSNGLSERLNGTADPLVHSREKRLRKKSQVIRQKLDDVRRHGHAAKFLPHFQTYARDQEGLLREDYRREIWPLLAAHLPPADHLDDEATNSARDSCSLNSASSLTHLAVPSRLTSDSRTCSESEVFDSARSSLATEYDDADDSCSAPTSPSLEDLQKHPEWNQVELDVHRTLARFPPNTDEAERLQLQADLTPMIVELLAMDENFRYYQGFHDVCLTLMLALDVQDAKHVGRQLVERGAFRNYLTKPLEESALRELHLMYVILHKCDPELERRMRHAELGTLFALSWPLTWFSHALDSYEQICRCFDLFLASHPLMPVYVSAALVENRRGEVMSADADMPSLHKLLNHVPKTIDIDEVLQRAQELFLEFRPKLIQGTYLRQYEKMCERKGRLQRIPPAETLQRANALRGPWLATGVAVAGVAIYWALSHYKMEFSMV